MGWVERQVILYGVAQLLPVAGLLTEAQSLERPALVRVPQRVADLAFGNECPADVVEGLRRERRSSRDTAKRRISAMLVKAPQERACRAPIAKSEERSARTCAVP